MSKSSFMPLEVVPDWLIESPITFDDLKCTSPPSTIFRMSLPPSPVAERRSAKQRSPTHQRLRQHGYEHEYEFEGRYEHDYPRESMVSIIASSDSESDEDEEEAELVEAKPVSLVRLDLVEEHTPHTQDAQQGPTSPSAKELPPDSQSFLWCDEDVRPDSDSDSDDDDDDATLNEHDREQQETDPSPIDPFFVGPAPGHPSHSQSQSRSRPPSNPKSASPQPKPSSPAPSPAPTHPTPTPTPDTATTVDPRSPWFMHFDAASLAALDNQLLQSPVDAFADLCYAHAVQLAAPSPAAYSWRRFSRLRPLTPFDEESESQSQSQPGGEWGEGSSHLDLAGDAIEERERDQEEEECQCPGEDGDEGDESASDTDSDVLASPEQAELVRQSWGMAGKKGGGGMGLAGRPRVYSPTPGQYPHEHRHARHFHAESDGSIQFGLAGGVRMSVSTGVSFAGGHFGARFSFLSLSSSSLSLCLPVSVCPPSLRAPTELCVARVLLDRAGAATSTGRRARGQCSALTFTVRATRLLVCESGETHGAWREMATRALIASLVRVSESSSRPRSAAPIQGYRTSSMHALEASVR
ncbi:hypothetical protein C8Q76DRAFT_200722 [Earliella scabrosa]|nr:hypothetical protein C8Q76DRAFT_200722 [Earliella scabrosa]